MLVSERKRKQAVLHFKEIPVCCFRIKYLGKKEQHLKRKLIFPLRPWIYTQPSEIYIIYIEQTNGGNACLWNLNAEISLLSICRSFNIFHQFCVHTVTQFVIFLQCNIMLRLSFYNNASSLTTSIEGLFPLKFSCKIRTRNHVLNLLPQHRHAKELEEKPENYIAPNTYSCFYGFISAFWEIA